MKKLLHLSLISEFSCSCRLAQTCQEGLSPINFWYLVLNGNIVWLKWVCKQVIFFIFVFLNIGTSALSLLHTHKMYTSSLFLQTQGRFLSFFRYQAALDAKFLLCSLSLLLSIYFPCKLFSWSWCLHGKAEVQPGRCKEMFWRRIGTTNAGDKQLLRNKEDWKAEKQV